MSPDLGTKSLTVTSACLSSSRLIHEQQTSHMHAFMDTCASSTFTQLPPHMPLCIAYSGSGVCVCVVMSVMTGWIISLLTRVVAAQRGGRVTTLLWYLNQIALLCLCWGAGLHLICKYNFMFAMIWCVLTEQPEGWTSHGLDRKTGKSPKRNSPESWTLKFLQGRCVYNYNSGLNV